MADENKNKIPDELEDFVKKNGKKIIKEGKPLVEKAVKEIAKQVDKKKK